MPFPKVLYAKAERDRNDIYFVVDRGLKSYDTGDTVGIYKLVETKKVRVARTLENA